MTEQAAHNLSPEELAALDELARLLEQYQAYLIAGYPFADATRSQASNASGTARPVLQRLHPQGAEGAARFEAALRVVRSEDDRKIVLEDVESALRDLRALIATVRWRQPGLGSQASPVAAAGVNAGGRPAVGGVATAPSAGSRPPGQAVGQQSRAPTRSMAWVWVGLGLAIGLVLGLYRTAIPRSAGALARLWTVFEPILAAVSGAVVGEIVLRHGFAGAVRRRWGTLLICTVLLTSSAPGAIDAGRELFGIRPERSAAEAPTGKEQTTPSSSPAAPDPQAAGPPVGTQAPAPPIGAQPAPARSSSAPPAVPAVSETPAARGGVSAPSTPVPPASVAAECARLLERLSLGETLAQAERAFLKQRCRN